MERTVKCPKCGFIKTIRATTLQWLCPSCKDKAWIKVDLTKRRV